MWITASQQKVCAIARHCGKGTREGERHAVANHFDRADFWIWIWRLSSGTGMGILWRRRHQPDSDDHLDSAFAEGDLTRLGTIAYLSSITRQAPAGSGA